MLSVSTFMVKVCSFDLNVLHTSENALTSSYLKYYNGGESNRFHHYADIGHSVNRIVGQVVNYLIILIIAAKLVCLF